MPKLETSLTRLLGIEHPILLAPMGGAAGGKLAAAVTNAGGLGFIGSGYADAETVARELTAAGNTPIGIGFILWALEKAPEVFDKALESSPPAVMLSFGDPGPYVARAHAAGAKAICQVQSLEGARRAAEAGVDVIVAQGRDAGGHSGTVRGSIGLTPAIVDAVAPIPVVSAGGFADGRGLAAALTLGAAGVMMGTRFAGSAESGWTDAMKTRLNAGAGDDTGQTRVFDIVRGAPWPEHYPGRALKNDFSAAWHGREDELAGKRSEAETAYLATAEDDFSQRVVWAGEGVDLVGETLPAETIIRQTIDGAIAELQKANALVR